MDTNPPSLSAPRGNDKIWALLCHLSIFISLPVLLPLVVYLAMRGDPGPAGIAV